MAAWWNEPLVEASAMIAGAGDGRVAASGRRSVVVAKNYALIELNVRGDHAGRLQQLVVDHLGRYSGTWRVWITPGIRKGSVEIRIQAPNGISSAAVIEEGAPDALIVERVIRSLGMAH
jgi:hypothetical protein